MSVKRAPSVQQIWLMEEFTTLAVAAAIGVADAGIGIEAAARRLKLDFIPLFVEDYYRLCKRETVERTDVDQPKTGRAGQWKPSLPWGEPDESRFTDL